MQIRHVLIYHIYIMGCVTGCIIRLVVIQFARVKIEFVGISFRDISPLSVLDSWNISRVEFSSVRSYIAS